MLYPNIVGYLRLALLACALVAHARSDPISCASFWLLSVALDAVDGWLARVFSHSSSFGALLDVVVDNASRSGMWLLAVSSCARGESTSTTASTSSSWPSMVPAAALACITAEWATFLAAHTESFALTRHWKAIGQGESEVGDEASAASKQKMPPPAVRRIRDEVETLLPATPPAHVQAIFRNGFRNPFGAFALAGLFGLPLSLYLSLSLPFSSPTSAESGWQRPVSSETLRLIYSALASPAAVTTLSLARLFAASAELWVLGRHLTRLVLEDAILREEEMRSKTES